MQSRSTPVLPETGNTCEVCGGLGGGGGGGGGEKWLGSRMGWVPRLGEARVHKNWQLEEERVTP